MTKYTKEEIKKYAILFWIIYLFFIITGLFIKTLRWMGFVILILITAHFYIRGRYWEQLGEE